MNWIADHHTSVAVFIARIFLGFLFFFQGYDAVFSIKIRNVIRTYEQLFENKGIPAFVTVGGAWFTSLAELIGGTLLILGLFRYEAMVLLGADLIFAGIAFGITQPMWNMRHVFPRLLLLLLLFLLPPEFDRWTLDSILKLV